MLENPNPTPVNIRTTFMTDQGPVQIPDEDLPGESTFECDPVEIIGAKNFSTKIESLTGAPIAVERWMNWTEAAGIWMEGHSSVGVNAPAIMKRTMGMETIGAFSDTIVPALGGKKARKSGGGTGRMKALESKLKDGLIRGGVWGQLGK